MGRGVTEQAHRLGDDLQWPHTPTQHPEGDAHRRADRRCLLGRAEESAADHSCPGPHQGPHPDERGSGQGVAPAHPEHHRTHDDDEQGLAQRESEVAEGLAQDEVTCSDRSCEGTREDAEPAGLDYRGAPGERVDEHEQDQHCGSAVVVAQGQEVALAVDDLGADRHNGSLPL